MRMDTQFCRDICCTPKATVVWESYGVKVSKTLRVGTELDALLQRLMEDVVDYTIEFNQKEN